MSQKEKQPQGVFKSQVKLDNDPEMTLHHRINQPSEDVILERNKRIRNEKPLKDLSFGRQVASVPFILWTWAVENGFDLNSPDAQIAQKEMFRFLNTTPQGKACMVQDKL